MFQGCCCIYWFVGYFSESFSVIYYIIYIHLWNDESLKMLLRSGCFRVLSSTLLIQEKKKKFNFLFVVCQVFQAHAELHTSYIIFLIETSAPVNSKSLCLWRDLCLQLHKLNWKCLNSVTLFFPKEWKPFSDRRFLRSHLITPVVKWQCLKCQCLKAVVVPVSSFCGPAKGSECRRGLEAEAGDVCVEIYILSR